MLDPRKSLLVVMDAPATSARSWPTQFTAHQILTDAAALLAVPRFATRYPDTKVSGLIATAWPAWISTDEKYFDPVASNWATTPLGRAIALTGRSQVILCGFWLEEAITMLALKCLAFGIDIYIPVDATAAINPIYASAAHARLTQAGAVPTTSEQVLREWGALSGDVLIHAKLLALLDGIPTRSL